MSARSLPLSPPPTILLSLDLCILYNSLEMKTSLKLLQRFRGSAWTESQPGLCFQGRWSVGLSHGPLSLLSRKRRPRPQNCVFTFNKFPQPLVSSALFGTIYSRLSAIYSSPPGWLPPHRGSLTLLVLFLFPVRTSFLLLSGERTRRNKTNTKSRFFLTPWNLSSCWGFQIFGCFYGFFLFFFSLKRLVLTLSAAPESLP